MTQQRHCPAFYVAARSESQLYQNICLSRYDAVSSAAGGWPVNGAPPFSLPNAGDSTAVRLSAPGAVRHDVAHQVVHVVLQIPDDVLDDVSDRDHAHDLARVQHWQMAKTALSHHCHAAFQRIVRLDGHRVARHHLAHRRLLRIEPGQQHFDRAVTLGHDTNQHVVVDYQHRPDPVVAHLEQGFDHHVAGTNMDQGATLVGQSAFYCAHRSPLVGAVLPRLDGPH